MMHNAGGSFILTRSASLSDAQRAGTIHPPQICVTYSSLFTLRHPRSWIIQTFPHAVAFRALRPVEGQGTLS
jgi:hypothetical protein